MRTLLRDLVESTRRWGRTGATRNARLEVETTTRSVVELEHQLAKVSTPSPPRAA